MKNLNILDKVLYGSRLYGTDTETSDFDYKAIYIPSIDNMLLGKKFSKFRERYAADGTPIDNFTAMMDSGEETEYIPLQVLIADFTKGQTYATELMFALIANPEYHLHDMAKDVVSKFKHNDVISMVSFAKKQTMDYISRARRAADVDEVLTILADHMTMATLHSKLETIYDKIPEKFHIVMEKDVKPYRGIYIAGRQYSERTSISDIYNSLTIIQKEYGTRVKNAILTGSVDWPSMSSAIRCYEEALELFDTGVITFPRKNSEYLRDVKQGKIPFDIVKPYLEEISDKVDYIVVSTPAYTEADVDQYIVEIVKKYLGI